MTKHLNFDVFSGGMRNAVLAALDAYMCEVTQCSGAKGWRDQDLDALLSAVDEHANCVAARFNDPESK